MSENKKSYFAVIPAKVRYDKTLPMGARMLYGEFTALSNEKGYCYASNNYFASLYEVTPQAISKWINLLADKKYISIDYIRDGKLVRERHIYIEVELHTEVSTPIDTVSTSISEVSTSVDMGINKGLIGYQQKIKENNTDLIIQDNNTNNNKSDDCCNEVATNKKEKIVFPKSAYSKAKEAYWNNCGLLYVDNKISVPKPVLETYIDKNLKNAFKSYGVDTVIDAIKESINHQWLIDNGYLLRQILGPNELPSLINKTYKNNQTYKPSNKQNKTGENRRFDGSKMGDLLDGMEVING